MKQSVTFLMSGGDEIGQHVSLATKLVSQEPKGDIIFSFF